jgi:hypothetical protein
MILAATNQTLEIDLAGAVAANQLPFSVEWSDITAAAFTPGHSDGTSNNTTAATMVAAPGASTYRAIAHITIYNKDTAAAVVTVQFNNNTTIRELVVVKLDAGNELTWSPGRGWRVSQIGIASDTKAGIIRIAGPGEVDAGTDLATVVTPGYQGYHKAMCKCWGKAAGAGTLTVSYNTTSVTDTGTGALTVNIATDFYNANYSVVAQIARSATSLTATGVEECTIRLGTVLVGSFRIDCYDHTTTTMVVQDPQSYFWSCFGSWL